jgi:hypothetical protein
MLKILARGAKFTHLRSHLTPALFAVVILAGASPRLFADSIFFSGNLRTDATVTTINSCGPACTTGTLGPANSDADYAQYAAVVDSFTISSAEDVRFVTYSYGGGTSVTGAVVAAGGFEPYLSLFDGSGNFLASANFDGITCPAGANTYNGNCYDVSLDAGVLAAGTYQIALTDWQNMSYAENYGSGNLSDGFTGFGQLQPGEDLNYGFDVILPSTSTPPSSVPEPDFTVLAGTAFAALFFRTRMTLRTT